MAERRHLTAGPLWIMRTGVSWREMPAAYDSWQTVYSRYQCWCQEGFRHQVLDILSQGSESARA